VDRVTKKYKIEGMTCSGCENRIEKGLKSLVGIEEVKAKFSDSTVEVTYINEKANESQIIDKIESLDYKVILGKKYTKVENNVQSNGKSNILQFIGIIVILIAVYLLIQNTIGFNFIPEVNQSMGYGMLFVIGLLTSLHCVAMCGGINISQCASYKDQNYKYKFMPSILYNIGRVISYTLIGGIFGAFGSLISISEFAKAMVSIISGVLMLIMGLNMLNIFPWLRKLNPKMPKFLTNKFNKEKSKKGPLYVGLLNGLMPCGPLQAMQIYALGTGNFISGSMSMFLFSLGTVPLMFGLGALSSFLTSKFNHNMMKVSAALVIILGIIMMNRGASLTGMSLIPDFSGLQQTKSANVAVISDAVQTVTTRLENGRYSPIVVQKGIPVKWTIKVEQGELNGCNNPINIPEFKMTKKLVVGDNLIEFTPTETKNIIYTCWMGMISSSIKVVDDLSAVSSSDLTEENLPTSGGAGCCGSGSSLEETYPSIDSYPSEDSYSPSSGGCCGI
jgi:sulfite exporter TauE/SafE/copper chaperone CopZ